jgi:aminopeptidase N
VVRLLFAALLLAAQAVFAQAPAAQAYTIQHYTLELTPDLAAKSVQGLETVRLRAQQEGVADVVLDSGALVVDSVALAGANQPFEQAGSRTTVHLRQPLASGQLAELALRYHGTPKYGMSFGADGAQIHTAFSTSQWMPCVDAPDVRATLDLTLLLPADLVTVGNGRLIGQQTRPGGLLASRWLLEQPMPSYLYGFAAGHFRELSQQAGGVQLRQLAPAALFSEADMRKIFSDTEDMLAFYQAKAGVPYPFAAYTQVLLQGSAAQEAASFSLLGERYGQRLLIDEKAEWLGAHEAAHSWWGNGVTNQAWTHFWLNEGVATFMTAAYLEHRFGHDEYMRQIDAARAKYEALKAAGNDKPLVFPNWDKPTASDRSLVYDKGAYVVHLLRLQMGEEAFWRGLQAYTRRHWGRSVTTSDFQAAMAQAYGKPLDDFFAKWVYLTAP